MVHGTIKLISWRGTGFVPFPKGISPKVNVIAQLVGWLVCLFGISTFFLGYLMPKTFS